MLLARLHISLRPPEGPDTALSTSDPSRDDEWMTARQALELATLGGARALNLSDVGRLAPGWQADLQLIDSDFPTPAETHNLYDQLVLYRNHTHVRRVMVAGQTRVRDGVVLGADWDASRAGTQAAARRLWEDKR